MFIVFDRNTCWGIDAEDDLLGLYYSSPRLLVSFVGVISDIYSEGDILFYSSEAGITTFQSFFHKLRGG